MPAHVKRECLCGCGAPKPVGRGHCASCHAECNRQYRTRKAAELREYIAGLRKRIRALEAENAELRRGA